MKICLHLLKLALLTEDNSAYHQRKGDFSTAMEFYSSPETDTEASINK